MTSIPLTVHLFTPENQKWLAPNSKLTDATTMRRSFTFPRSFVTFTLCAYTFVHKPGASPPQRGSHQNQNTQTLHNATCKWSHSFRFAGLWLLRLRFVKPIKILCGFPSAVPFSSSIRSISSAQFAMCIINIQLWLVVCLVVVVVILSFAL